MKLLFAFSFVICLLEELEGGVEGVDVKPIYTNSANECRNESKTEIICNLTALPHQYIVHITEKDESSNMKLSIIGAKEVKLIDSPKSYQNITLINCMDVEARTSKYSNYKLYLDNTNASSVDETVKYFKSVNSRIKTLLLRNTTEFDISQSGIKMMKAKSDSLTPNIMFSNIESLELEVSGDSRLNILNSTIETVKKLKYDSSSESLCSNSTLQNIEKESIVISKGKMEFLNTILNAESKAFHIQEGELIFNNIGSRLSSDSVILSSNGSFLIKSKDSDRVFTMNFKIEEVFNSNESDNHFFPLKIIIHKDNTLTIVLSVMGLVMFFIILEIIIYIVYRKFLLRKGDPYKNNLSDFMTNNDENKGTSKFIGRENLRDKDLNTDVKSDEEKDYGSRKASDENNYTDSQVSPSKIFPLKPKNDFINQEVNPFENVQEEYIDNEIPDEELVEYTQPDSPHNMDELYSDNMYPSEQIYNPHLNKNTTNKSEEISSYSDNIYPTRKVSELKEKLNKSGFINSDLHNPYQKPKQINQSDGIESKPLKLFPKPANFNLAQNSQTGKPNLPNVSFLSRNKDQIRTVRPANNLPQLNPSLPPNFLLNKTLPPNPPPSLSSQTIQSQLILPEQNCDEENFYEEYVQN